MSNISNATPTQITPQAAMASVMAVKMAQEAPALFETALFGHNSDEDIPQMEALLNAVPDLLDKLLPKSGTRPVMIAARNNIPKLKYLLDNGASKKGVLAELLRDSSKTVMSSPDLQALIKSLLDHMLMSKQWDSDAIRWLHRLDLSKMLEYLYLQYSKGNPTWLLNPNHCDDLKIIMGSAKLCKKILTETSVTFPSLTAYVKNDYCVDSWKVILGIRPDLLENTDNDGNFPLHFATKLWIQNIASKMPAEMLQTQLTTANKAGFTPWLHMVGTDFYTAQAIWNLQKSRRLGIKLAQQRGPKLATAMHIYCKEGRYTYQRQLKWLEETCKLSMITKNADGRQPWEYLCRQ